ncbi:MAG TPA: hypothetical protein VL547_08875 [Dinghuibacter sp.]|uniref:hypothetical protein n=1 Tax=Dinghuibacter sp. TaxID=2024697 RepID=UPI002B61FE35|nr:hypothetical protein [Dinghuibacter sp.]HTJ12126.1 hypothetical protein [Dinghuibacter sp.]
MKHVLLMMLGLTVAMGVYAQRFSNGVGIAYFNTAATGIQSTNSFGLTYSPKINVTENDHFSLSVGLPISVGMSVSTGGSDNGVNGTDINSLSLMADVPLLVNLNFGAGSSRDCEDRIGFFVGAGVGYHHTEGVEEDTDQYGDQYDNNYTLNVVGPAADAGVRFGVGQKGHNIELRGSFLKGLDASKANIFGVGALFNF